jgi:hypothetical protein
VASAEARESASPGLGGRRGMSWSGVAFASGARPARTGAASEPIDRNAGVRRKGIRLFLIGLVQRGDSTGDFRAAGTGFLETEARASRGQGA